MHGLLHALGALLVLPYAMLAGAFLMIGEVARSRGLAAVFDVLLNQADWMLRWGIYAIPLACCALVVMGFVPRLRRAGLFCLGLISAVSLMAICGLGAMPLDRGELLFLVPCLSVLATSVLMLIRSRRIPGAGRTLPALVALLLSSSAVIGIGHASDAAAATAAQTRDLPAAPSATGANSMSEDRGDPMRVREANPNDAASLLALPDTIIRS